MIRKVLAILAVLALGACLVACGKAEDTTLTGMVTAVDGTVISVVEMDRNMGDKEFDKGERPSRPEGTEDFGSGFQQWGDGEITELPEGEMPQRPENGEMPEIPTGEDGEMQQPGFNGEMPEMPTGEDGQPQRPDGEDGGRRPGFESFEGETTQIDIGNAHISLEIDGGKASGTLEDITPGSFVTITRNSKGEVTNVLVSSGFGGRGDFGGRGGFGGKDDFVSKGTEPTQNDTV